MTCVVLVPFGLDKTLGTDFFQSFENNLTKLPSCYHIGECLGNIQDLQLGLYLRQPVL